MNYFRFCFGHHYNVAEQALTPLRFDERKDLSSLIQQVNATPPMYFTWTTSQTVANTILGCGWIQWCARVALNGTQPCEPFGFVPCTSQLVARTPEDMRVTVLFPWKDVLHANLRAFQLGPRCMFLTSQVSLTEKFQPHLGDVQSLSMKWRHPVRSAVRPIPIYKVKNASFMCYYRLIV